MLTPSPLKAVVCIPAVAEQTAIFTMISCLVLSLPGAVPPPPPPPGRARAGALLWRWLALLTLTAGLAQAGEHERRRTEGQGDSQPWGCAGERFKTGGMFDWRRRGYSRGSKKNMGAEERKMTRGYAALRPIRPMPFARSCVGGCLWCGSVPRRDRATPRAPPVAGGTLPDSLFLLGSRASVFFDSDDFRKASAEAEAAPSSSIWNSYGDAMAASPLATKVYFEPTRRAVFLSCAPASS